MQVVEVLHRMVPTLAGLAAIPFIVHPIDNAVHVALNRTLRPYMKAVICDGAGGRDMGLDMCPFTESEDDSALRPGGAPLSPGLIAYVPPPRYGIGTHRVAGSGCHLCCRCVLVRCACIACSTSRRARAPAQCVSDATAACRGASAGASGVVVQLCAVH